MAEYLARIRARLSTWFAAEREKAQDRRRREAELHAQEKAAFREGYERERIRMAREMGRDAARAREQGGGWFDGLRFVPGGAERLLPDSERLLYGRD